MRHYCSALVRGLLLALLLAPHAHVMEAQPSSTFKVVVNRSNPRNAISREELSEIFLLKKKSWSDGSPITPIDLTIDSPVRDAFSRSIHGRPTHAVISYWRQQVFAGRGIPPREMVSDVDVIAFVKESPRAIGYVSALSETTEVKVVNVD
jgi:ABC-type phosphate transport system substrate-binding protein